MFCFRSPIPGLLWLLAALIAGKSPAWAEQPDPAVVAFEQFIAASSQFCKARPAADCIDMGWRYADTDEDGFLSLDELMAVRDTLSDWRMWRGDSLKPGERMSIALGLWVVDAVGLDSLVDSYSTDGDQRLTRKELLADVTLDKRPLRDVLLDPDAVDRAAVAQRLGSVTPVLEGLMNGQD